MQKENQKGLISELDNKVIDSVSNERNKVIEGVVNSNRHERRRVGKLLKMKIKGVVTPFAINKGGVDKNAENGLKTV